MTSAFMIKKLSLLTICALSAPLLVAAMVASVMDNQFIPLVVAVLGGWMTYYYVTARE